jgi:1-acyl-sn-glycerol-3-phosphate acyltransferase
MGTSPHRHLYPYPRITDLQKNKPGCSQRRRKNRGIGRTLQPFPKGEGKVTRYQPQGNISGLQGLERKEWVSEGTKALIRLVFFPFYHLETTGTEYLPKKTAFLLLPKHQCWQDIPLMAIATPQPLYYVAKHELFENSIISQLLKSQGGIPLNRQRPLKSRDSIRAIIRCLKTGEGVVVFPEGTYYPNRMGPGKGGILKLIISRLALPLIPVGIRYRKKGLRTHVTISFGKPIYHEKKTSSDKTLGQIMKEVSQLSCIKE